MAMYRMPRRSLNKKKNHKATKQVSRQNYLEVEGEVKTNNAKIKFRQKRPFQLWLHKMSTKALSRNQNLPRPLELSVKRRHRKGKVEGSVNNHEDQALNYCGSLWQIVRTLTLLWEHSLIVESRQWNNKGRLRVFRNQKGI